MCPLYIAGLIGQETARAINRWPRGPAMTSFVILLPPGVGQRSA
jgi:hypothetical protein